MPIDSLRFYLNGESAAVHTLYEFLFLNTRARLAARAAAGSGPAQAVLPAASLRRSASPTPRGCCRIPTGAFLGYRLLQEYFTFPEKFLFFDLTGLDRLAQSDFGGAFEILIFLKQPDEQHRLIALEQSVERGHLSARLHARSSTCSSASPSRSGSRKRRPNTRSFRISTAN